jgi:hypothetical protein
LGLTAVHLDLVSVELDDLSHRQGKRKIIIPPDIRGARACPYHSQHIKRIIFNGRKALRFCIKGVQLGGGNELLQYPQGHCYVLGDRLIIREQQVKGRRDLIVPFKEIAVEPQDVPHAYQYDGGHFRVVIHGEGKYRAIACYTRLDRDDLVDAIRL